MAALSIVSMESARSRAQVIGDVGCDNATWLSAHLRELEGDVTLDCRGSAFVDPAALMVLVDFEEFLRRRGNRLRIEGVPAGPVSLRPSRVRDGSSL